MLETQVHAEHIRCLFTDSECLGVDSGVVLNPEGFRVVDLKTEGNLTDTDFFR